MVDLYIYTFYDDMKYWIVDNGKMVFELETNTRQISGIFYDLLDSSGVEFKEIQKIVFINGPGSFTSLRFFLTFAKALKVSFPDIEVIPLNLLEMMAFTQKGEINVIMGGSREFLKFFHYGKYKKTDDNFEIVEDVKLISYEDAKKIVKPLFIGVKPDFEIQPYNIELDDMISFSDYKSEKSDIEDIISLTPYYYKHFVTKKL